MDFLFVQGRATVAASSNLQLKYKDVEAKFERGLVETEAKVTELEKSSPPDLPSSGPEITSRLELLRRIADASPRAAIMEAWVLVEDAASKSGFVQGTAVPRVDPHLFVQELVRLGKLPKGSDSLLAQMRKLRNQAAHLPDFSLNRDEADRYLELAAKMSEPISMAKWYTVNCANCGAEMTGVSHLLQKRILSTFVPMSYRLRYLSMPVNAQHKLGRKRVCKL